MLGTNNDALSYLLENGLSLDEISRYLGDGISMIELVTAVQDLASRREAVSIDTGSVKPADYSDAGNAAVFVREYSSYLTFVDSMGWLFWDGKRWDRSEHKALMLAMEFSERLRQEAMEKYRSALQAEAVAKANNPDGGDEVRNAVEATKQAKAYLSHANVTRRAARIKAILDLSKPGLHIPGSAIDANPTELNTQGGIIDLVTGKRKYHRQASYCTLITAETEDAEDAAEIWQIFLDQITCDNRELKDFLQMVIGMALFGKVYHEGIAFAVGDGRNGKSTFFNAVGAVLGDYTGYINIDVVTTKGSNDKASLATLRGKRMVIAGELEEGRRLSAATVKKLASTDPFQVEEKYKQPEVVKPSHTLFLFTNHLPRVGSTDMGTWRRILIVPFNAVIEPEQSIQNFGETLAQKASSTILAWAIEGAQRFAANNFHLDIPQCVKDATEEYRRCESWLENFVEACCEVNPEFRVQANILYAEYRTWAGNAGEYVRCEKDFAAEMDRLGYSKIRPRNVKHYIGLKLQLMERTGYGSIATIPVYNYFLLMRKLEIRRNLPVTHSRTDETD